MPKKEIILKSDNTIIYFDEADLPMLIHGAAHAGASLFSVTAIVNLFLAERKVLFFTAYPMAKEEFSEQIKDTDKENKVFYLQNHSDIKEAHKYEVVIVKSGDSDLCTQTIKALSDVDERIIFVKNIESILTKELFEVVSRFQKIILSGDLDQVEFRNEIVKIEFLTKILFSTSEIDLKVKLPELEKYVGFMSGRQSGLVTTRIP